MKITFLGNFVVDFSSETHWSKSMETLGHEVVRLQEGQVSTEHVFMEASKSDLFVWVHTHDWETHSMTRSQTMLDVLKELRKIDVPTAAYHLDLYMGLQRWTDYENDPYLSELQYFFTVDKFMAEWLNENTNTKGVYVPAGVFDRECIMLEPQRVGYEIVFTGSRGYHPEHQFRPQLIDFLRNTYGNKFIHIGNDGQVGTQRGLPLNQIYRNAKIVVGDTLQINFDYPYYYSDRAFEVPGRGGFSLFPNIKGLEECYEDGKEIVLYEHGNFEDLKDKIDYYLVHDEEREAIRKAGFERTKRDHTYVERWKFILETVAKNE